MTQFFSIRTDGQPSHAVAQLLQALLQKNLVQAVLVPAKQPLGQVVMPSLITDVRYLETIDPFAPVAWSSAATLVGSLTFKPQGIPIAAVLRSCELRALIELVKLKQGSTEDLLLIGLDCWGRYENRDYLTLAENDPDFSRTFLKGMAEGQEPSAKHELSLACQICQHPVPEPCDLRLCLVGSDPLQQLWLEGTSPKGEKVLQALELAPATEPGPPGRAPAVQALIEKRQARQAAVFAAFKEKTATIEGLRTVLSPCSNCYNCRGACPVCYCRQCVFCSDTFRHDGQAYWQWSKAHGRLKMPTDTLFYHLTRMVHVSTLCVGCGQCSSACPNGLPLLELMRTVAEATQGRFEYLPGRDLEEKPPLATFHDNEFAEITGQRK
jgi:formate dehydrogenase subunit beta